MRKYVRFLTGLVVILGVLMSMTTCLDPTLFPEELKNINLTIDVTGQVDVNIVSKAVLVLKNWSHTIKVTKVEIWQELSEKDKEEGKTGVDGLIERGSYGNGKPESGKSKATYLDPSTERYTLKIFYKLGEVPGQTDYDDITLSLPGEKQTLHLFLDKDDKVEVLKDDELPTDEDAKPGDLVTPEEPDPDDTEGSWPAVVPPSAADKLGYCIVRNMTNGQDIDSVSFALGNNSYAIGKITPINLQSITLRSGQWEAELSYTRDGEVKTLKTNIMVFLSNSPQAPISNYLYFYKNDRGNYSISTEWPPVPYDVDEQDIIPLDRGNGSGVIKIINHSNALVTSVMVSDPSGSDERTFNYDEHFIPAGPIQHTNTGFVDVKGDDDFQVEKSVIYLIMVTLETTSGDVVVSRKGYLYNQVVTITIHETDIDLAGNGNTNGEGQIGKTVIIQNQPDQTTEPPTTDPPGDGEGAANRGGEEFEGAGPTQNVRADTINISVEYPPTYEITAVQFFDNDNLTRTILYDYGSWDGEAKGKPVGMHESAEQVVLSSTSMPITNMTQDFFAILQVKKTQNGISTYAWINPSTNNLFQLYSTTPHHQTVIITLIAADLSGRFVTPDNPKVILPDHGFKETVTIRLYHLDGVYAINDVYFVEAPLTSFPLSNLDACKDTNTTTIRSHVNGNANLIKFTGHTGVQVATKLSYYNASANHNSFVTNVIGTAKYTKVPMPNGSLKNGACNITLELPASGNGWIIYFKKSSGWFISYTNPGLAAPGINYNKRFFLDPRGIIADGRYYVYVGDSTKPYVPYDYRDPENLPAGASFNGVIKERVIPIGFQDKNTPASRNTTSIMKVKSTAAVDGKLTLEHDAN